MKDDAIDRAYLCLLNEHEKQERLRRIQITVTICECCHQEKEVK